MKSHEEINDTEKHTIFDMIGLAVEALGRNLEDISTRNEIIYRFDYRGNLFDVEIMCEDICRVTLFSLLSIPYEDLTLARSLCGGVEAGFKMVKIGLVGSPDEEYPVGCYTYFDMPMIYHADAFVELFAARVQDCIDCSKAVAKSYQDVVTEQAVEDIDISEIQQLIKITKIDRSRPDSTDNASLD